MRLTAILTLLALALVAAGCGARHDKPFTAKGTVSCLRGNGFTNVSTSPAKVGFIAGFAANGGLIATSPTGNAVTVAFTEDENSTASTEKAFRLHASPALRPHMQDVMSTNRNAVIVWTTGPRQDESQTLNTCLRS